MIDLGNVYLDHLGQILGPFQLTLGSIGLIITVFATIAIINAFNMIDGIDGLLGGLSIVSFAAIGILMFRDGQNGYGILEFWLNCSDFTLSIIKLRDSVRAKNIKCSWGMQEVL